MSNSTQTKNSLMKSALWANALFSTISGGLMALFSAQTAALIGTGAPLLYLMIGIGLLGFAVMVGFLAMQPAPRPFDVLLISMGDLVWVIGTAIVIALAYTWLNPMGIAVMVGVAICVLAFALAQLRGIEQLFLIAGKTPATHRICMDIETDAPADALWAVIADMGNIKQFSPHLATSMIRNNETPDVGAIRDCSDDKGNAWSERCTVFSNEKRDLTVEFLTDAPKFPYPFRTMIGGWRVAEQSAEGKDGSVVTIWFETTPKHAWATPIILAMMSRDLVPNFSDVVARMAAAAMGQPVQATKQSEAVSLPRVVGVLVPC